MVKDLTFIPVKDLDSSKNDKKEEISEKINFYFLKIDSKKNCKISFWKLFRN